MPKFSRVQQHSLVQCGKITPYASYGRYTPQRRSGESVRIRFSVPKMCQFGHSIKVIGNIGDLGGWNVEESLRLEWSEGHVWTGEIEVDSRMKSDITRMREQCTIEYKYVVVNEQNSPIEWLPGDNLAVPEVDAATIVVHVKDVWGVGYREIKMEKISDTMNVPESVMVEREATGTREAFAALSKSSLEELGQTLGVCTRLLETDPVDSQDLLNADRELAAVADRTLRFLRASEAL